MTDVATTPEEQLVERVQEVTGRLEAMEDLQALQIADELAGALGELYGEGLTRIFGALQADGAQPGQVLADLAADGVVATLMAIHELHPVASAAHGEPEADEAQGTLVADVEACSARLNEIVDAGARALADELAASVVQLHGAGLTRIFAALAADAADIGELRSELQDDGVVASLMLMHDLYPVPMEERVLQALEEVRPYLDSHGGDMEYLGIHDGVVRLKLIGHCRTCAASASTLEVVVEDALRAAAPDLAGMEVEGVEAPTNPIPNSPAAGELDWLELEGAEAIERGMVVAASQGLLVANVAGTLLAYRDACAGCRAPMAQDGILLGGTLTCGMCGNSYDLPRAGRCRDDAELQLTPIPLLRGAQGIRVAVQR